MKKNIDEIICIKCGTRNPDCVYNEVGEVRAGSVPKNNPYYQVKEDNLFKMTMDKYNKCIKEHLVCTCWKCNFMWIEKCLDDTENKE